MARSGNTSAVTAKEASVTGVPDGVLRAVAACYEAGSVRSVDRLIGGLANDVFRLETDAGRIALLRPRSERAVARSYQRRSVLATARLA